MGLYFVAYSKLSSDGRLPVVKTAATREYSMSMRYDTFMALCGIIKEALPKGLQVDAEICQASTSTDARRVLSLLEDAAHLFHDDNFYTPRYHELVALFETAADDGGVDVW